jgi:hypothetical protein
MEKKRTCRGGAGSGVSTGNCRFKGTLKREEEGFGRGGGLEGNGEVSQPRRRSAPTLGKGGCQEWGAIVR